MLKNIYLGIYNFVQLSGWGAIWLLNFTLRPKVFHLVCFFQALMVIDFLNSIFKLVPNNPKTVFSQVFLRNYMSIFVLDDDKFVKPISANIMIFAWSSAEVCRYLYYIYQSRITKYLRYKLFPLWFFIGIFCGEIPTIVVHLHDRLFYWDYIIVGYFLLTVPGIFSNIKQNSLQKKK